MIKSMAWEVVFVYTQHYLIDTAEQTCALVKMCMVSQAAPPAQRSANLDSEKLARVPSGHGPRSASRPAPRVGDAGVGTFLHFSDIHFDSMYSAGALSQCSYPICCRVQYGMGTNASNTAGKFGEYNCDSSAALLASFASNIKAVAAGADFALWTGDDPPHDVWSQSREYVLASAFNVTQIVLKALGSLPVVPALGNHESFPVNQFEGPSGDNWLYSTLAKYWGQWLSAEAQQELNYGGYYSQLLPGTSLRFVAVNSMYCGDGNYWLILNQTDPGDQQQWLAKTLAASRAAREKVYILGHIPWGGGCQEPYSSQINALVADFKDVVVASFFGHTHMDEWQIHRDSVTWTEPLSVGFVSPSVTPDTDVNPSFRVYLYNRSTFEVLDIHQYVFNLTDANKRGVPSWNLSYTMRAEYGMDGLAAGDFQDLLSRMATDDSLWAKFMLNRYTQHKFPGTDPAICDSSCRASVLCYLAFAGTNQQNACQMRVVVQPEETNFFAEALSRLD